MKNQLSTNKTETINGILKKEKNRWVVVSGYGTFPLSTELQSKPEAEGEVAATVQHGQVIKYGFSGGEKFD